MDGGSVSPDLLTSLLGDSQLMERVSQLVAQSRAASADTAPDSGAVPTSSDAPTGAEASEVSDSPLHEDTVAAQSSAAGTDRLGGLASLLGDNELMSRLPDVLSMLSPDKPTGGKPSGGGGGGGKPPPGCDRRIALLSALKPYMSPRRCEAIDYLIRINRMGDILRRVR